MKEYKVYWTLSGETIVETDSMDEAQEIVEEMYPSELIASSWIDDLAINGVELFYEINE